MAGKLTPKERIFIVEYLKDRNATKAAIAAGYSKKSAKEIGYENLTKPHIRSKVEAEIEAQEKRTRITSDSILTELHRIKNTDVLELFDENGALKPIAEIPLDLRRAIRSIETDELWEYDEDSKKRIKVGITRKITLWDKIAATNLLGKNKKLWVERVEHETGETLSQLLEKTWKPENKK